MWKRIGYYLLIGVIAFLADVMVESYYFALTHQWVAPTLGLAVLLPWMHMVTAIVLIDAKTWRERIIITGIYSVALLASTIVVLWGASVFKEF